MKEQICKVCGNKFLSINGNECCSDICRMEWKKMQDAKGNYRRYNKLSNVPEQKVCIQCGKIFESVRRKYCSDECSELARKQIIRENNKRYYENNKNKI